MLLPEVHTTLRRRLRLNIDLGTEIISKRPTSPALAVRDRAWEACSVIGKLVSTHDDGYGFGWPGAPAAVDDL